MIKKQAMATLLLAPVALAQVAGASDSQEVSSLKARVAELEAQVESFEAEKALEAKNVALYDEMDLVAFTGHDMKRIAEIHADDVVVYNPDGSVTRGMTPNHERELQWLFDTFPDIEINEHPIKFGSGDWTAGMSVTTGTFSEPMKLADGSEISPTGKPFKIRIVTLVRWEDGRIAEEYLFWDNLDWNRQIGIAD